MPAPIDQPREFVPFRSRIPFFRWMVNGVFPAFFGVASLGVIYYSIRLAGMVPEDLDAEARAQVPWLLAGLAFIAGTTPVVLFGGWFFLRRDIILHRIVIDEEGIRQWKGGRERSCRWDEVEGVSTTSMGRVQLATVKHRGGTIRFDSGLVDASGAQPSYRIGMNSEYISYDDGTTHSLAIEENELYQVIRGRIPEEGA